MADPSSNTTYAVHKADASAIIDTVKDLGGAELVSPVDQEGAILILPNGKRALSVKPFLDEYLPAPERRTGTAKVTDLDSFIDLANRFKDANSAIFAVDDRKAPSLTVVLNYHEKGGDGVVGARFGDHRVVYAFPLSDEWKAWVKVDGEPMLQADFAAFLEERVLDVAPVPEWALPDSTVEPSADAERRLRDAVLRLGGRVAAYQKLVELSRGLAIAESSTVENRVTLDSGEAVISFKSEHTDGKGERVNVPNLFMIAIPIFRGGPAYLMAVRLRYRIAGGKIAWFVAIARMDEAFDHAFREAAQQAHERTELPLFYGTPEEVKLPAPPKASIGLAEKDAQSVGEAIDTASRRYR